MLTLQFAISSPSRIRERLRTEISQAQDIELWICSLISRGRRAGVLIILGAGEKKKGKEQKCNLDNFCRLLQSLPLPLASLAASLCSSFLPGSNALFAPARFVSFIPLADAASMLHPTHLCCYVWSFSSFTSHIKKFNFHRIFPYFYIFRYLRTSFGRACRRVLQAPKNRGGGSSEV